ncbi:MAG TPA: methyltransferase domain-containing protein [Lactobacillaceae bacterium]|jgi:SAM-dependent methyltransferase
MNDNFTTFAQLYDDLFEPDMYDAWADYVRARVTSGQVLDLGGGAGRLAVQLAQAGFQVDVLDLSGEMLNLANAHANEADVDVRLLQADMRDFADWQEQYDVVTSFADSLNYLPNLADLKAAFAQVKSHLKPGGTFLFDVITPWQVNVGYDNYFYNNDDNPEQMLMWTSFPGEALDSVDHDLKFFVYDEAIDGFKLLREIHHEQTYARDVYIKALQDAGFTDIRVTADFGERDANDEDDRWFFEVKA